MVTLHELVPGAAARTLRPEMFDVCVFVRNSEEADLYRATIIVFVYFKVQRVKGGGRNQLVWGISVRDL